MLATSLGCFKPLRELIIENRVNGTWGMTPKADFHACASARVHADIHTHTRTHVDNDQRHVRRTRAEKIEITWTPVASSGSYRRKATLVHPSLDSPPFKMVLVSFRVWCRWYLSSSVHGGGVGDKMVLLRKGDWQKGRNSYQNVGCWRDHCILALTDLFCVTVYRGIDSNSNHSLFWGKKNVVWI